MSRQKVPLMTMAMEAAMPKMVSRVRSGRRCMVRRTMRTAGLKKSRRPQVSTKLGRKRPGAGGRMASAGASCTVAAIARQVAPRAATRVMAVAAIASSGRTRWRSSGKRNTSAYSPENQLPSQAPTPMPISTPRMTMSSTSLT